MSTEELDDYLDDLFAIEPPDAGLLRTLARHIPNGEAE